MRVTNKMFYDRFLVDMQSNLDALYKANEQLSSGKRVNRPSDDPAAMTRIVGYKATLMTLSEYTRSIDTAKSYLNSIDSSFVNLGDMLTRAHELAINGASGTVDSASKKMIAKEVAGLVESVRGIANTKVGDRYLFSGYTSNQIPIDQNTGEFVGDSNVFELDISHHVKVAVNIPGGSIFSFRRINATDPQIAILPPYNFNFDATVSPVTGETETPADADPVSALHLSAAVADPTAAFVGAGGTRTIAVGANDTPVTFNVPAGTTLNGLRDLINDTATGAGNKVKANIVSFGPNDYRLVISSKPVGKSDQISISVAGGDANLQRLQYDTNGKNMTLGTDITNYNYITDTTNPNFYSFNNNYLNGSNILRALHFLKTALENADTGRIQKAIGYINSVSSKVDQLHAEVGARLNKLDAESTYIADRDTNVRTDLSHDQDADLATVVTEMQQRQTALQSLRTVSSGIFQASLFDFLK